MKNLVIGNTSQQSYYYPDEYIKISSRDIDFNFLKENIWDSVYITFAEQRIYDSNFKDFMDINYFYTLKIIENLINNSNKIVIFTSCELWNNYIGKVSLENNFNYTYPNHYCLSKNMLIDIIKIKRNIKNDRTDN